MRFLRAFGRFWWEFIVGDDWTIALGVVLAMAAAAVLTGSGVPAWFLLPSVVLVLLGLSVRRARASFVAQRDAPSPPK